MYDIQADPHNIDNLADDERYSSVLKQMRKANREFMLETKDTGFIPEAMKIAISETGTIYDFARSTGYPLERILETTEIATSRDIRYLKTLTARLADENPIVRFWAATGCTILGEQAMTARLKLVSLLRDSEPTVRVAAAEALYAIGDSSATLNALLNTLKNTLKNDNIYVRLQALTVLEAMGNDARPVLSEIKQFVQQRSNQEPRAQPSWKYPHDVKIARQLIEKLSG